MESTVSILCAFAGWRNPCMGIFQGICSCFTNRFRRKTADPGQIQTFSFFFSPPISPIATPGAWRRETWVCSSVPCFSPAAAEGWYFLTHPESQLDFIYATGKTFLRLRPSLSSVLPATLKPESWAKGHCYWANSTQLAWPKSKPIPPSSLQMS